eukprot:31024-Pelagococcus_subviridis.AAC.2
MFKGVMYVERIDSFSARNVDELCPLLSLCGVRRSGCSVISRTIFTVFTSCWRSVAPNACNPGSTSTFS